MSGMLVLASNDIMSHLAPRYEWHLPGLHPVIHPGEHSGFTVDLAAFNHWVQQLTGINPDVTTHVVMMGFAALLCLFFFLPVARSFVMVPRGLRNFLEPVLLYVRDEMVYPWMGEEDGRKFLPYIWTLFFFILACNLIGLLPAPFGVTATGNFNVTGALAVMSLLVGIIGGMVKKGGGKFWVGLVPHGVPGYLWPLVFFIEVAGLLTRHVALMVRLFANMTGGHAILAVLAMWTTLMPALLPVRLLQILGSTGMICFEILIALIQAYIFAILSAIYIGLALAEEH